MKNLLTKYFLAFLFAGILISASAQKPSKPNTDQIKRKWLDVAYATASPAQKLDIYIPEI